VPKNVVNRPIGSKVLTKSEQQEEYQQLKTAGLLADRLQEHLTTDGPMAGFEAWVSYIEDMEGIKR
jgi:hypothetical protein